MSLFLDDGRVELDSNMVERTIRPLALTRKNALFAGSDAGAGHWAVVASLVETCKLVGVEPRAYFADVFAQFDHVIESSKAGVRKPDPRIYRMMYDALGVDPRECVYLDDLGINLKPAREMGMQTIKVDDPDLAIAELEAVVGFPLR